ncbi:MAG: peptide-methionine (S)-S-oxide reductase [Candidatus Saccharibacteria bacterium]|nr:peptide-methionine (S)-S-oxide reductase [Candidatus Saccharibacteria bacterium]
MTSYVLAGGCFWCLDAVYRRLKGVSEVVSGYSGGQTQTPSYYEVSSGETGHAEVVRVTFDETVIPAEVILDIFFLIHDPTSLNRQGADVGTQYRSAMFYSDDTQKVVFEAARERAQTHWDQTIVTKLSPLEAFYPAEDEHQDYFEKHPDQGYCQIIISPKLSKARGAFQTWFKE